MKKLIFALGLLFLCSNAWANTCTYTGAGGANASDVLNWSGCGGVAPTTGDIVIFDGAFPVTGNDNCTWNITADIASINTTGYTGLVTASVTMTVAGSVTFATSTFAHGNQKIVINNASTVTTNSNTMYDFTIDSAVGGVNPTITLGDNLTVNNIFALTRTSGSGFVAVTINSNTINLKGDVTMDTAAVVSLSGTASFKINGTGTQNINGATSNNLKGIKVVFDIDKSSGTAYLKNTLVMEGGGGLKVTSGTFDATTYTPTIYTYNITTGSITVTFDINVSIYNLTSADASGYTTVYTLTQALTVTGTWTWLRSGGFTTYTFNTSDFNLQGGITLNTFDTITINGTSAININGGANQTLAGCTSVGNGKGFGSNLTINKSANTLSITDTLPIQGATLTYTAGTVSAGTSTLRIQSASTLNTNGMSWYDITQGANITLASDLDFSHNFTRTSGAVSGAYYLSPTGATTHVIDGTNTISGFDCATGETCSFDDADIFTITNGKGNGTWQSDDATNTVDIDFTAETISSGAGTRVDSAGGVEVVTSGTITDCVNWSAVASPTRKLIMVVA